MAGTQTFLDIPPSVWYAVQLPRTLTKFLSKVMLGMKLFGSVADKAFVESIEELDEAAKVLLVLNYGLRAYQGVSTVMEGDGIVSVGSQTAGLGETGATTVLDGFDNLHLGVGWAGVPGIVGSAGPTVASVLEGPAGAFAPMPGDGGLTRPAPLASDAPNAPPPRRMPPSVAPPALRSGDLTITAPIAGSTAFVDSTLAVEVALTDTTGLQSVTVFFQGSSHVSTVQSLSHRFLLQVSPEALETQPVEAYAVYEDATGTALAAADVPVTVVPGAPLLAFSATPERNRLHSGSLLYPAYVATFETFLSRIGHASTSLSATVDDPAVVAFDAERSAFRAVGPGGTFAVVSYGALADTLYFTVDDSTSVGNTFSVSVEPTGTLPIEVPASAALSSTASRSLTRHPPP